MNAKCVKALLTDLSSENSIAFAEWLADECGFVVDFIDPLEEDQLIARRENAIKRVAKWKAEHNYQ